MHCFLLEINLVHIFRYRCLDLRRPQMNSNIILRHRVVKLLRRYLEDVHGFVEVIPLLSNCIFIEFGHLFFFFFLLWIGNLVIWFWWKCLHCYFLFFFSWLLLLVLTPTFSWLQGRLRLQYYLDLLLKVLVIIWSLLEFRYSLLIFCFGTFCVHSVPLFAVIFLKGCWYKKKRVFLQITLLVPPVLWFILLSLLPLKWNTFMENKESCA